MLVIRKCNGALNFQTLSQFQSETYHFLNSLFKSDKELEISMRELLYPKWIDKNGDDFSQELKNEFKSAVFQLLFKTVLGKSKNT